MSEKLYINLIICASNQYNIKIRFSFLVIHKKRACTVKMIENSLLITIEKSEFK